MEERISKLEDKNLEMIQVGEERKLRSKENDKNLIRTIKLLQVGKFQENGYPRRRRGQGEESRQFI